MKKNPENIQIQIPRKKSQKHSETLIELQKKSFEKAGTNS